MKSIILLLIEAYNAFLFFMSNYNVAQFIDGNYGK